MHEVRRKVITQVQDALECDAEESLTVASFECDSSWDRPTRHGMVQECGIVLHT